MSCRMNKIYRKNLLALQRNCESYSVFEEVKREGGNTMTGTIIYVHPCSLVSLELTAQNFVQL